MSNFSKVGVFMKTFGQEVKDKPSFSTDKIKHAAIYLGDGLILQHKYAYVSNLEYIESYIPLIRYILRKNE